MRRFRFQLIVHDLELAILWVALDPLRKRIASQIEILKLLGQLKSFRLEQHEEPLPVTVGPVFGNCF